jgi:hypothetical protein
MAGMNHARKERASYSRAGYAGEYRIQEENELYIASEPAGSAQDELRDYNRVGYRSERPWNETPVPVFEAEAAAVSAPSVGKRVRQETFFDRLAYHARRERRDAIACVVLLAVILMMTGLLIGGSALEKLIDANGGELRVPGVLALVAAVVSIVTKEAMYWYTRFYAKQLDSGALMADAWHHRSDALSSVGALIGIGGCMGKAWTAGSKGCPVNDRDEFHFRNRGCCTGSA